MNLMKVGNMLTFDTSIEENLVIDEIEITWNKKAAQVGDLKIFFQQKY